MPRPPKPFFWEARGEWYVTIDGTRHRLGPDKKPAHDRFHDLMSERNKPAAVAAKVTVAELFDRVLAFTRTNRSEKTDAWYEMFLQGFVSFLVERHGKPAIERMRAADVTGDDLQAWLDSRTDWGPSTKRGAVTAVKRAFNYGVKHGLLDRSPVRAVEKPQGKTRDTLIGREQFDRIVATIADEHFRDLLTVVWLTGCRPQEAVRVEARFVHDGYWLFPKEESKGKKRNRVVFLTDEALAISRKWAERHPTGPIFRNTQKRPWTASAVNCRFTAIQIAFGRAAMAERGVQVDEREVKRLVPKLRPIRKTRNGETVDKSARELYREAFRRVESKTARSLAPRFCAYNVRHSYAHHGLTEGRLSPEVMATLLGHSSTDMIYATYGHLVENTEFMRDAAGRVRK